jgi:RNA-directed DNA polymerase
MVDGLHFGATDNHYLLDDLERQVGAFVEHYNHVHYHESVDNPDPG